MTEDCRERDRGGGDLGEELLAELCLIGRVRFRRVFLFRMQYASWPRAATRRLPHVSVSVLCQLCCRYAVRRTARHFRCLAMLLCTELCSKTLQVQAGVRDIERRVHGLPSSSGASVDGSAG